MRIVWSEDAVLSYKNIIDYIFDKWYLSTLLNFKEKVNSLIYKISNHKKLCPKSLLNPKLRKCVLSKHYSLIYRLSSEFIEIVLFNDNRVYINFK